MPGRKRLVECVALLLPVFLLGSLLLGGDLPTTSLRFEVTLARDLLPAPRDGRVLVVLGSENASEPRTSIGNLERDAPPVLGQDALSLQPGKSVTLDASSAIFPLEHLARLRKGTYSVQAVFDHNPDLRLPEAPGNLVSEPVRVSLDPARGGVVSLLLSRALPAENPADTPEVKFLHLRSELLSKFHGRPMLLRAAVILPRGFAADTDKRYPLRVHIGGYGTRYTAARQMMEFGSYRRAWEAAGTPPMLLLHLDGAGPLGDPYQVNSANHGPYGDAITRELIPYVEKRFRGIGAPHARVLEGASTGGWVSLALQIFYPDFFNGCWSHAPDPVDFRAYELIDIYKDDNAFVNTFGFERPAARTTSGDVKYTVRHEVRSEIVLGRGDNWTLSGKDWAAWNATFGPRGKDGLPVPLWDGKTGKIDRSVLEHWKQYDLRLHLERHWPVLAAKLAGKIRIWVGEADEYFLNNGVHLLERSLMRARPVFDGKITFGPGQGHGYRVLGEREMIADMAQAIERGRPAR